MAAKSQAPGISNVYLAEQLSSQHRQRAKSDQARISAPAQRLAPKRLRVARLCRLLYAPRIAMPVLNSMKPTRVASEAALMV